MFTHDNGSVTLTKEEYDRLGKRLDWLSCLEDAGVDNWPGIEYAYDLKKERYPEEE